MPFSVFMPYAKFLLCCWERQSSKGAELPAGSFQVCQECLNALCLGYFSGLYLQCAASVDELISLPRKEQACFCFLKNRGISQAPCFSPENCNPLLVKASMKGLLHCLCAIWVAWGTNTKEHGKLYLSLSL